MAWVALLGIEICRSHVTNTKPVWKALGWKPCTVTTNTLKVNQNLLLNCYQTYLSEKPTERTVNVNQNQNGNLTE